MNQKSIRFCTCAEDEEAENAHKGNQVKIDDEGDVYVNNAKIDEPYLRQKTKGDTDIEFPYTVPNGKLFVIGDKKFLHRMHSGRANCRKNRIQGVAPY